MMHAAMGLSAGDVDETSRCSDRWRGQIKILKKFSGQNIPCMTGNYYAARSLFKLIMHPFYIIIEAYMEGGSLY